MSLYSLGADAATRRSPTAAAPRGRAVGLLEAQTPGGGQPDPADAPPAPPPPNALQALVMFVPAETVAIFVTVATSLVAAFPDHQIEAAWTWYVICLLFTPAFAWIGFATVWRSKNGGAFPALRDAPWFRIVASLIAFGAWGLAVSPLAGSAILCHATTTISGDTKTATTCNAEALTGILVLIVGAILTALDGLIDYTPKPSA